MISISFQEVHYLTANSTIEVPHRDVAACRIGIILVLVLALFESEQTRPRIISSRFRSIFAALSTMEIMFTVFLPWLIILEGSFNRHLTTKNGHLLASHLFIFQAQIACECIIELAGDKRRWLMFPFTCLANLYRGVTIATWIYRVLEQPIIESRDVIVPLLASALWMYSSFIFIPREWYPALCKKQ